MPAQADRRTLLLAKKINFEEKQAKLQSKIDHLNEVEKKLANGRKILGERPYSTRPRKIPSSLHGL
jgi:hypothetical protein